MELFSLLNVDFLLPFVVIFLYLRSKSILNIPHKLLSKLQVIMPSNTKIAQALIKINKNLSQDKVDDPVRLDYAFAKLEVAMITLHSRDSRHMVFIEDYLNNQVFHDMFDNLIGIVSSVEHEFLSTP